MSDEPAAVERPDMRPELVFWRDLAEDLRDPEFRYAFEQTWSDVHGWNTDDTLTVEAAADRNKQRLGE